MAAERVDYDVESDSLVVRSRPHIQRLYLGHGFYAPLDWVGDVLLSSLIGAGGKFRRHFPGRRLSLYLTKASEDAFLKGPPPPDLVSVESDGVGIDLMVRGPLPTDAPEDPDETKAVLSHTLESVVASYQATITDLTLIPVRGVTPRIAMRVAYPWRGRKVVDAHTAGMVISRCCLQSLAPPKPRGYCRIT